MWYSHLSCHKYCEKRCTSLYTEFDQSLLSMQKWVAYEFSYNHSALLNNHVTLHLFGYIVHY